jgi:MFS family permease
MTSTVVDTTQTELARRTQRAKRAAASSFLGSMLEYYDFFIYAAAAALVFNKVFFPEASTATGLLLSLATFGVAYVARPIGAVILGHFGDKIGRKKIMLFTLLLMGIGTFLIGCLPDFNTIGWWAPILLVVLRLCQGLSAAGEQAGANAIILEHSPTNRRAFFAGWTMNGTQAGTVLATLVFIPVATLPEDQLLSWGWRVPFWLSIIVIAVAQIVRHRMEEPEALSEAQENDKVAKFPVIDLFRTHPVAVIRLIACALTASMGTIFLVFGLSYATNTVGLDRADMLWVSVVSTVVACLAIPFFTSLSDKIGRKPVYLTGLVACAATTFLYFGAISTGNLWLIHGAAILMNSFAFMSVCSVGSAFYPEMFHTRVRYSGSAIGTQLGYAVAGFVPTIGYAIMGAGPSGWVPVAIMAAVIMLIAFVAAATARETYRDDLTALGNDR